MPRIETLIDSQNICDLLDDDELGVIGRRVIDDFEKDKESMSEWLRRNEEAEEARHDRRVGISGY